MLCEQVLKKNISEKAMGADIASANYQQEPIDLKGRLYQNFQHMKHALITLKYGIIPIQQTLVLIIFVQLFWRQKIIKQKYWMFYLQRTNGTNGNSTR